MTVKAKICGLKTPDMVDAAIAGGADMIGLVHFARSPRHVEPLAAATLANHARGRVTIVSLLVDPSDEDIDACLEHVSPDILQLHGNETPERADTVRRRTGRQVMKAVKVETAEDAAQALAYKDATDLILFDAKAPKGASLPGGNGLAFDWRALAVVTPRLGQRWMLSGGLTPRTVAEAIRLTGAPAVDVSSGVETAPGIKDADLIGSFLHAAKTAKQQA